MHRLRCSDGSIENSEMQKSHSVLASTATGNDRIDVFSSKVRKLILQFKIFQVCIKINILILTHRNNFR